MNSIARARRAAKISREKLSRKIDIGAHAIYELEKTGSCSVKIFLKICSALGLNPRECKDITVVRRVGRCGWQPIDVRDLVMEEVTE